MKFLLLLLALTCGQTGARAASPTAATAATVSTPAPPLSGGTGTQASPSTSPPQPEATTTAAATAKLICPAPCSCYGQTVDCRNKQLTQMPKLELKSSGPLHLLLAGNNMSALDLRPVLQSGAEISTLQLSGNQLRSILPPTKANKNNELAALRSLDLSGNQLESLANLSGWSMPNLQTLNIAANPLARIEQGSFGAKPRLSTLIMCNLVNLGFFHEDALDPVANLANLTLAGSLRRLPRLPEQLFASSAKLATLDLSDNNLVEVPTALRATSSIRRLRLDANGMISLRHTDFINQTSMEFLSVQRCNRLLRVDPYTFSGLRQLAELHVANNEQLHEFSGLAFAPQASRTPGDNPAVLSLLNLSGNNLTTLSGELLARDLKLMHLNLARNPWDCSCALEWLVPGAALLRDGEPVHCATPAKLRDMELGQALTLIDCQPGAEESTMQRFILVVFLLFLIVLTVAVFVQRADICRRLQWRDQYGTIYYTKASFPTEQV